MGDQWQTRRKTLSNSSSSPVQKGLSWQRPFSDPLYDTPASPPQQMPDLQARLEQIRRAGPDMSRVKVSGEPPPAFQSKLQWGQKQENINLKPEGETLQRQQVQEEEKKDEDLQMKPLADTLQRQQLQEEGKKDENLQMKSLGDTVQRQETQEEEKKDEDLQMKPLADTLQRPEMQEEENKGESLQMKSLGGTVQRQGMEEEQQEETDTAIQRKCSECQQEEEEKKSESVQTKLTIGKPGDKYEQEADNMAARVMTMPDSAVQQPIERQTDEKKQEVQMQPLANSITPLVQRSATTASTQAGSSIESNLANQKGGGSSLPDDVRSFMEPRFGADLSQVRVHTDSAAVQMNKELGAQAFTHGNDVFYGAGKSPGKDELTAHELTHTIQQTGGVQAKLQTPSETASTKTERSGNEQSQAVVTASSAEAKTELSAGEGTDTKHSSQKPGAQAEVQENGRVDKEKAVQSGKPKLAVSVESTSSQGQTPQMPETGSEAEAKGETNSAKQAVQAVNPKQQVQLPSEVQAQAEGKQTRDEEQVQGKDGTGKAGEKKGKALEEVPQAQALKQATTQNKAASPKPEDRGEVANLPAEGENQKAKATGEQGKAQLEATNAQAQQLASAGVNFAPPEEEQAGQVKERPVIAMKAETPSGDAAARKERSARASSIASGFVATASGKVQAITGLGTKIPARIQGTAENAKARVRAAVEQQKAAVTAQFTQQRAKAQSEAQATIAKIQAQYQATIAAIPGETAKAREKVNTEYATSVKVVDAREKGQITQIEGIYTRAAGEFRNAGRRVGDEAVRIANQKASEYKSRDSGAAQVASFLGLGAVSDVAFGTDTLKNKARAQAAEAVGQAYKEQLVAKGEECAKQAEQGKQKDIETVRQTAAKSRETLQTQQKAALDSLKAAEQQAKQQAQQAQTQLTQTAKQSLEATLTSLNQQKATQLQMLTAQGQQQIAAIEGSAEKAIASLQKAINQSASGLRGTLQTFQAQAKTAQAPDPNALSAAVAQAQGQIDREIGKIRAQVEQGIAASVQSITQSGQQSVEGLSSIGQGAIKSATTLSQGLTTTMTGLKQSATDTFKQIQQAHTKTTTQTAKTAVDGFKKVTEGIEKTFQEMSKGLESQFQQHVKEVEKALQGALKDLPAVINEEAEKAAAQVDPKKELLKLVVIVAVVVVAALVVGPFAAGLLAPLGAMGTILAGAAVGALSGAVIQMASNAIDGKNILEGVGQAALGGAIGGALGAGIGMAVGGVLRGAAGNVANRLGERAGSGLRSAGNFALDVAEETIGDIATNIATGQFSWDSIGESLLFSVFGAGLSRSAAGQRISDGVQNRGTQIRSNVSDRVRDALGGSTGDRTPIDVSTPGKPPVVDETTPTDKTPSSQSGDRTPTDVSTPTKPSLGGETAPTKPPVAEEPTPNGRSTHFDEPEVEPGVVAKDQTANGREIKVTKEGEVLRCMGCEVDNNPRLEEKSDPQEKIEEAKKLDEESAAPDNKRKAEDTEESGESSTKRAKTEEEAVNDTDAAPSKGSADAAESGGPQYGHPRRAAAERANEAITNSGKALAEREGYSDAPDGYHWANQNGKPILKRNPDQADQLPELRPNPENPQEFIPVVNPPKDYKWVSQGNSRFTVEPESPDLPPLVHNPKTGGFIFKDTGEPYVPPFAKGEWKEHKWGDPSKAPCFPPGTVVKTPKGDRNIEDLVVGDLVIAYDFESNALVTQPILHLYKNWTQHLVDTNVGDEMITSTRRHPFWVESSGEWLPALQLKSGMTLRTVAHHPVTVEFAKVYASDSTTYNLEVSQVHNYFVGTLGVLVHNGDESSNFEDLTRKSATIYEIVDTSSGQEVVVYRGKTTKKNPRDRFKQHLTEEAAKKADWQQKYDAAELEFKPIIQGNWTDYETAVWEKHFIDEAVALGYPLVNDLKAHPISKDKYEAYKHLHAPCP